MKQKHKRVISLLILISTLVLLVIFASFLKIYIYNPAILFLWTIWHMISGIPQNVYWIALVLLCTILIIRLIPPKNSKKTSKAYRYQYKPPNRLAYWQSNFADSRLGTNEKKFLLENLRELYDAILDTGKGSALPPDAEQYVFKPDEKQNKVWFLIPKVLRRRVTNRSNQSIYRLLEWMEKELEITHDS